MPGAEKIELCGETRGRGKTTWALLLLVNNPLQNKGRQAGQTGRETGLGNITPVHLVAQAGYRSELQWTNPGFKGVLGMGSIVIQDGPSSNDALAQEETCNRAAKQGSERFSELKCGVGGNGAQQVAALHHFKTSLAPHALPGMVMQELPDWYSPAAIPHFNWIIK